MAVENNMDDELDQVSAEAMQIIMSAGDARVSCNDALKAIAEGSVETAKELIKKAEGQIAEAHHVQTDAIQGSIGGETQTYSLLFAHAQDTLMTVYSEIDMSSASAHWKKRLQNSTQFWRVKNEQSTGRISEGFPLGWRVCSQPDGRGI